MSTPTDWRERFKDKFEECDDNECLYMCDPQAHAVILTFIEQVEKEAEQREREKCRQIYIEEVDWSEWGMSDEEVGRRFDRARTDT